MYFVGDWHFFVESVRWRTLELAPSPPHRLVGVVFAPADIPETNALLIPSMSRWSVRSSDHIDFFWPGYEVTSEQRQRVTPTSASIASSAAKFMGINLTPDAMRREGLAAKFSTEHFENFRRGLDQSTRDYPGENYLHFPSQVLLDGARYSGGLDLLLLDVDAQSGVVNFGKGVYFHLSRLNELRAGLLVYELFESIFTHAEYQDSERPLAAYQEELGQLLQSDSISTSWRVGIMSVIELGANLSQLSSIIG
jgi:hypothetical protein